MTAKTLRRQRRYAYQYRCYKNSSLQGAVVVASPPSSPPLCTLNRYLIVGQLACGSLLHFVQQAQRSRPVSGDRARIYGGVVGDGIRRQDPAETAHLVQETESFLLFARFPAGVHCCYSYTKMQGKAYTYRQRRYCPCGCALTARLHRAESDLCFFACARASVKDEHQTRFNEACTRQTQK